MMASPSLPLTSRSPRSRSGRSCKISAAWCSGELEAVDTPDEHTAVFRFSAPTPFQLIRNALPVVTAVLPKHVYAGTDIARNPANVRLVGTGPYRFAELQAGRILSPDAQRGLLGPGAGPLSTRSSSACCRTAPRRQCALEAGEIGLAAFSAVPPADPPCAHSARSPGLKVYANERQGG